MYILSFSGQVILVKYGFKSPWFYNSIQKNNHQDVVKQEVLRNNLKQIRTRLGMSQQDLASLAGEVVPQLSLIVRVRIISNYLDKKKPEHLLKTFRI
ncbi:hypothetical protein [Anabaena subtropica]|uniref:HTH cro/C1-type domain-containing protein n=1 Tax=Anabaena subtropica FACHB-260 TaxID=2692884 RepID=A0ABR8CJW7_9NOST|nr:hypothetical protein [Anabaena subtropica]MBD2342738.1 hypothetical protein [Anabaena subtropica FACHB-260]